ncbi:alpha-N-acetylgalactosaminidase-like isoform X2 [Clytia hemisphaerica]|uniref:Alpha-galactosidase n=1 Tax=Clytia hemisphaerica TaxID=252671 RepID=A0A7M6DN55_9CNID
MKLQSLLLVLCIVVCGSDGLNVKTKNDFTATPPMGWLQWERYRCILDCETYPEDCIRDSLFMRQGKRLHDDGYAAAGYVHVNIDDCWSEMERDANGTLIADKKRFPNGLKSLADYMHNLGLKLGIYTDMGTKTCAGYPAAIFHMQKDTQTFADWGIDMIKLDGCNSCTDLFKAGHEAFKFYINQTGREMLYSCEWPSYLPESKPKPYEDIAKVCNTWRNGADVQDSWSSVMNIINYNGDHQDEMIPYIKPGSFLDPDMLLIGDYSLSEDQSKTQFAIWSIMAAPLMISANLETMKDWQKAILLNEEIIAVDQDSLGKMGRRVYKDNNQQTWTKPLADGGMAVAIVSTREDIPVFMSVDFKLLNITGSWNVRDLYALKDLGSYEGSFKAMVNPSGVVMVKLTKASRVIYADFI